MAIIDKKGRLFGKINVIDAVVLVLIGIFVVAGLGYLVDTSQPVTVHAQVTATDVPTEAASALEAGGSLADGRIQVTDAYTVPQGEGRHTVYAKLEIRAEQEDGAPLVVHEGV